MTRDGFFYRGYAGAICCAIAVLLMMGGGAATAQESVVLQLTGASDGGDPQGGVIADSAGNLYGTTTIGGPGGYGAVFEVSPPTSGGAWTETTLHSFSDAPDGFWPVGPLTIDTAGNLYGTTDYGGLGYPFNYGMVFELSPPAVTGGPWTETIIHTFAGATDGQNPNGGMVIDAAGNLYGTTQNGGKCGWGEVFEESPPATSGGSWTHQVLYSFRYTCDKGGNSNDGGTPLAGLAIGSGGVLYGTTYNGGIPYDGTVFKLTPPAAGHTTWSEKVLHTFTGGSDGSKPTSVPVLYKGKLYGTATYGANSACYYGIQGCGTVFELSSGTGGAWTLTTLYSFAGGTDGANPSWDVVFDPKGNLYVSADSGGNTGCTNSGCGAVIELSPPAGGGVPWNETTLYDFTGRGDGGGSPSGMVIGNLDRLYGTTYTGGDATCSYYGYMGCGVVFRVIP